MRDTTDHSASSYGVPGIKAIREKLSMSTQNLADACNVSRRTVEGWEQGRMPDAAALDVMASPCYDDGADIFGQHHDHLPRAEGEWLGVSAVRIDFMRKTEDIEKAAKKAFGSRAFVNQYSVNPTVWRVGYRRTGKKGAILQTVKGEGETPMEAANDAGLCECPACGEIMKPKEITTRIRQSPPMHKYEYACSNTRCGERGIWPGRPWNHSDANDRRQESVPARSAATEGNESK